MASKEDIQTKIEALEAAMSSTDFWNDKNTAQAKIKELQDLKNELEGVGKYDKGDAIINIFTGAGGDDAAGRLPADPRLRCATGAAVGRISLRRYRPGVSVLPVQRQ